jgi:hypothetical protein
MATRAFHKQHQRALYDAWGTNDKSQATHYALHGGMLCVPDDQYERFLERYAASIYVGAEISLHENVRALFPLFLDIDFVLTSADLAALNVSDVLLRIQRLISGCLPFDGNLLSETSYHALVSMPSCTKRHLESYKLGMHVVWPNLIVDVDVARKICWYLCKKLNASDALTNVIYAQKNWFKIVDFGVWDKRSLNQVGLRMIGSVKFEKCVCVRNRVRQPFLRCDACFGAKRVCIGRVYNFICAYDSYGNPLAEYAQTLKNDLLACVRQHSLRLPYVLDPKIAPTTLILDVPENWRNDFTVQCNNVGSSGGPRVNRNSAGLTEQQLHVLTAWVYQAFPRVANVIDVTRPPYSPSTKRFAFWIKTDCRYCENVEREHASSPIWLFLKWEGFIQRCYSKKGSCSSYRGELKTYTATFEEKSLVWGASYASLMQRKEDGLGELPRAPTPYASGVQPHDFKYWMQYMDDTISGIKIHLESLDNPNHKVLRYY